MFFIFGITSKQEELEYEHKLECHQCGKIGTYRILLEYMAFSLFFIPIIKWNRKYYAISSCCQSVYKLNNEMGNQIRKGYEVTIQEDDLEVIKVHNHKKCSNCGFTTEEEFLYCPKCANKL